MSKPQLITKYYITTISKLLEDNKADIKQALSGLIK